MQQLFQKGPERQRVKLLFLSHHQTTGSDTDRSENTDLLASWSVQEHRVDIFRRNPHGTA